MALISLNIDRKKTYFFEYKKTCNSFKNDYLIIGY